MKKLFIGILAVALVVGMGFGVMANDNLADVEITGNQNDASIEQISDDKGQDHYDAGGHDSKITLDGNWNEAGVSVTGANAFTRINTMGSYNEAFQTQRGHGVTSGSTAKIFQEGSYNYANQSFGQQGQFALIDQDGDDNTAYQTMDKGVVNEQRVWQTGDLNESYQTAEGKYNDSRISQSGIGNIANTMQLSRDNNATINQIGNWNVADIDQLSAYNNATITQNGDNNDASIYQD